MPDRSIGADPETPPGNEQAEGVLRSGQGTGEGSTAPREFVSKEQANFLKNITPVILTYNEAPNIGRALAWLRAFGDVLVVDSGSSDETLAIVAEFQNARVLHRAFDSFSGQWNFALREGGLRTEWVLAMDADYILSEAFLNELGQLSPPADTLAYRAAFDYCILGKKLSANLYPPITLLYRHRHTSYVQDGHCMRAQVAGVAGKLASRVLHDDRKPLSRWLASQVQYAGQECELLQSKPLGELRIQDRLRRMMVIAPWLVPLYCLTVGRALFDGWPGVYYALQRGVAEALLALKLIEERLKRGTS